MRVAILGSVSTVIPSKGEAAIERIAYYQARGLADRGHKVLLFALAGSTANNPLVQMVDVGSGETRTGSGAEGKATEESLYGSSYKLRLEIANLSNVLQQLIALKDEYDVILNNLRGEAVLLPIAQLLKKPLLHVMHLPIFPVLADQLKQYRTGLISISNAQRKAFPDLFYTSTVYNCVDTSVFTFSQTSQEYVLYLGSIGKNKNPADAIAAAKMAGVNMIIGGRIKDQAYFESEIKPHIDGTKVQWVSELQVEQVIKLYQSAKAFLFPTMWEEPFGLVMIEAMSCGTPVIAYPHGAVPEIVVDGKTGFLVHSVDEMAEKIKQLDQIDRAACRKHVEEHFSVEKMIDGYEKVLLKTLGY